jgi:hypothetical protein
LNYNILNIEEEKMERLKYNKGKGISFLIISALSIAMFGCQMKMGRFNTNSHFAYPNSNIETLGLVRASAYRIGFISARVVDKDFIMEVYNKALSKSGGDMIIDYKLNTTTTMIFPLFITTLELDGTAAKMEVGMQELK